MRTLALCGLLLVLTGLARALPPDLAQIVNLSPTAQQAEIDYYVAQMQALS